MASSSSSNNETYLLEACLRCLKWRGKTAIDYANDPALKTAIDTSETDPYLDSCDFFSGSLGLHYVALAHHTEHRWFEREEDETMDIFTDSGMDMAVHLCRNVKQVAQFGKGSSTTM